FDPAALPAGDDPAIVQPLWTDRGHDLCHGGAGPADGGSPARDWPSAAVHPGVCAGWPDGAGARWRAGRALPWRRRAGAWLPETVRADCGAIRHRPPRRPARRSAVPDRGSGPLPIRWDVGVSGPNRPAGEGTWLPDRAGGGGSRPGAASG